MSEKKYYAGFWVRLFAGLLDLVILLPVFLFSFFFFGVDNVELIKTSSDFGNQSYFSAFGSGNYVELIFDFISILYVAFFVAGKKQATLGKRMMGIYVANPDGSKLSGKKSLARALASFLTAATLGLGFLLVVFTKEKTALHDLICNTRVFHGKKND